METGEHLAVLEVDVEEVKNDMMRRGAIKSAIGFSPPEDLMDYYVGAIAEIEDMQPRHSASATPDFRSLGSCL
jgi:hypothetical protein